MDNSRRLAFLCDDKRHLICVPYTIENLHEMAEILNIKRCWFHGGDLAHYDIPNKRIDEIKSRCTIVDTREIIKIIRSHQNACKTSYTFSGDKV